MFHRHFFRISYVTRAHVLLADVCFDAMTENLSAGGIFLRTEQTLPVGQLVTINFSIPSTSHPSITVKAEVLRTNQKGMALQFKSLDYHTFTNIKAFIRHKPLPYW